MLLPEFWTLGSFATKASLDKLVGDEKTGLAAKTVAAFEPGLSKDRAKVNRIIDAELTRIPIPLLTSCPESYP